MNERTKWELEAMDMAELYARRVGDRFLEECSRLIKSGGIDRTAEFAREDLFMVAMENATGTLTPGAQDKHIRNLRCF